MKSVSLIRWVGGKSRHAKHILPLIMTPGYDTYCEPFVGGAGLFLQKPRHKKEIINDLDSEIYNFLTVCKDQIQSAELQRRLQATPVSRQAYGESIIKTEFKDAIERAENFVIRTRQGFGAVIVRRGKNCTPRNWAYSRTNSMVQAWQSAVNQIPAMQQRLLQAEIEHSDALQTIKTWDGPKTMFYVDPPYFGSEHYYPAKFTAHAELAALLNRIKGAAVISYYDCPEVRDLYKGWQIKEIQSAALLGNSVGQKEIRKRTELLIYKEPLRRVVADAIQDGLRAVFGD